MKVKGTMRFREQKLQDVQVAFAGCKMQWCAAINISYRWWKRLQELRHKIGVASCRGLKENMLLFLL
jgi:hypothetical protein